MLKINNPSIYHIYYLNFWLFFLRKFGFFIPCYLCGVCICKYAASDVGSDLC